MTVVRMRLTVTILGTMPGMASSASNCCKAARWLRPVHTQHLKIFTILLICLILISYYLIMATNVTGVTQVWFQWNCDQIRKSLVTYVTHRKKAKITSLLPKKLPHYMLIWNRVGFVHIFHKTKQNSTEGATLYQLSLKIKNKVFKYNWQ